MKKNIIGLVSLFCLVLSFIFSSCEDKYYEINKDFYKGRKVAVKNPMDGNTLRIEQYNTDQIMLEDPNDSTVVYDNRGFQFKVADESIVKIAEDGAITPVAKGTTEVDIISRADANLSTSILIEIHKDYHPVERILITSAAKKALIEKGYELDIAPLIFVLPGHADNKKLHFSLDEASKAFANITDEGIITGISAGVINIHIVSDDNPSVTADLQLNVVNEIEVTSIVLHKNLNNGTIYVGEKFPLDLINSTLPTNVREENRKLTYTITSGTGVISIDSENILTALSPGTAEVKIESKYGITNQFTINVGAENKDLTRLFWGVDTNIRYSNGQNYVTDGSTGKPEDMFDDKNTTFLSLVKPGKSYSGSVGPPSGQFNSFTVDMLLPCKFKSLRWNHRYNNSYTYLRVWAISIEGSNDGENWSEIQSGIQIPNTYGAANGADANRYDIALNGQYEYRYVKVTLTNWSDNSGGATSGSSMQIGEFGLSK
ncbi:discoidin domain-containing protein [Dysgonomonas sp. BGC7]|uniref:discoidin domain-containing protein n=1 Tax=Dysgonomonas sp. BGC7 TaxID=1658008 RepID=UPI000681998B|nr:discoidin domain-containing protein [Dysgonomonas sp. BGC7]MBD8387567.1 discoidin domain-containing protein [Dysgonomonas sp. BGC7]